MPQYRTKPIVVDAMQFTEEAAENSEAIEAFSNGRVRGTKLPPKDRVLQIDTPWGEVEAFIGHWVVKGPNDTFNLLEADVFAYMYEQV